MNSKNHIRNRARAYIHFPTGYNSVHVHDDNLDLVLIIIGKELIEVFSATIFSIKNVEMFVKMNGYFWTKDMIVTDNLTLENIKMVMMKIIESDELNCMSLISEFNSKEELESIYNLSESIELLSLN